MSKNTTAGVDRQEAVDSEWRLYRRQTEHSKGYEDSGEMVAFMIWKQNSILERVASAEERQAAALEKLASAVGRRETVGTGRISTGLLVHRP